jgi:hypothetical protein
MLVAIPRLAATVQALILVALVGPGEPLVSFTAPKGPRALATVDAIRKPFTRGGLAADGPVYRYVW